MIAIFYSMRVFIYDTKKTKISHFDRVRLAAFIGKLFMDTSLCIEIQVFVYKYKFLYINTSYSQHPQELVEAFEWSFGGIEMNLHQKREK